MQNIKYNSKSLNLSIADNMDYELEKINQHTIKPLAKEDVYIFPIALCDNEVDRVGDKMTDKFLNDLADKVKGVTGLKDHDWSSDNQLSRLYDAEVVETDEVNQLGEKRKYVLGKAYTLSKYKDYIDKINAGLLKECSISFQSENDTCSICGCKTHKKEDGLSICENGHIALEEYDGKLCYNIIDELTDVMEWSLVAVPCQHGAGIKNKKHTGGRTMTKAELLIRQLFNSKSFKNLSDEEKGMLEDSLGKSETSEELSDDDIKKLVDENAKLKEEVDSLKALNKELESGRELDKIKSIVEKELDKLNPITPKVTEMAMKEIPWEDLKLEEDGQIAGMADVLANIENNFKGLFNEEEVKDEEDTSEEKDEVIKKEKEADETIKGCISKGLRPSVGDGSKPAPVMMKTGRTMSNTRATK